MSTYEARSFIPLALLHAESLRGPLGSAAKLLWIIVESYCEGTDHAELMDETILSDFGPQHITVDKFKKARQLLKDTGWMDFTADTPYSAHYWPKHTMTQHLLNDLDVTP